VSRTGSCESDVYKPTRERVQPTSCGALVATVHCSAAQLNEMARRGAQNDAASYHRA
jgi:hypothetical protein